MTPFVGHMLRLTALAYVIEMESALKFQRPVSFLPEAITTLSLFKKFHRLVGSPDYGTGAGFEKELHSIVDRLLALARECSTHSRDLVDIPPSSRFAYILCVPLWTVDKIRLLKVQEHTDPWIGEKYWLKEQIQEADRQLVLPPCRSFMTETAPLRGLLGPVVIENYIDDVAIQVPPDLLARLHPILLPVANPCINRGLESLWITHVRCLLQALHESALGFMEERLPEDVRLHVRIGLKVEMSNMILLGSTKIATNLSPDAPEQYYVLGFATLIFGMVERMISRYGFEGDEDAEAWNTLFSAMGMLEYCMISRQGYATSRYDVPGFDTDSVDPSLYGLGYFTRQHQLAEVREHGRQLHQFGYGLARYNPGLGSAAYQFPIIPPGERIVKTRPVSPELSTEGVEMDSRE
ncbi:hypothetical protein DFH07DRAFT_765253 [Mycena maculata]|uniref:Uncharacterized protein n=1 Tax=Mycena maculata TaxID=230809 RepID=A0AAD7K8R6_9AGAR|nr:hypothetical protein DFH07DRAFT_765253 [Mycena maculata]